MGQPKAKQKRPATEANPRIFDREHLRQYTSGDEALERELVGLFLSQFEPLKTQLEAASSAADWKFATHSLKGSARSIGAPQIAKLAEKLELMGYQGSKRSRASALARLTAAMAAFAREAKKALN